MQIYINDEKLDSTLDDEQNLGQIFDQITKWIESQGMIILNCMVDGKEPSGDSLHNISINNVNRLDFYIEEKMNILESSLLELDKYIDTIGSTLFGRDSLTEKESSQLSEGVEWVKEVLLSSANILNFKLDEKKSNKEDNILNIISILVSNVKQLDSITNIEKYLDNLRNLKLFVMTLINRMTLLALDDEMIKGIIETYSNNMDLLKNEFIRVNEYFQSGKDAIAGELLNINIEKLHLLISGLLSIDAKLPEKNISNIKILDKSFKDVTTELNEVMSKIESSMAMNDIIQAGDILEYELPEVLDKFVPFLKEISIKIGSKSK